jgi:hypothetical protein
MGILRILSTTGLLSGRKIAGEFALAKCTLKII